MALLKAELDHSTAAEGIPYDIKGSKHSDLI